MRRLNRPLVVGALLAMATAIGAATAVPHAAPLSARALATASLRSFSRVPLIQPLLGRIAPAQTSSPSTITPQTTATVQTDKPAYLPGTSVVASGSGWAPGAVIALTYTELASTDPKAQLTPPVQVFASTDGSGQFTTAGNPNGTFATDTVHDSTITMNVTASGLDATGNTVSVKSANFTNGVTVATDDNKYALGQPMTISGAGYTPGGSVSVTVVRPDKVTDAVAPVTAAGDGTFQTVYVPPPLAGRYNITATDGTYTAKTAATQADAIAVDFKQCSNNNNTLGACNWINSILQKSNSVMYEGMSTLQRMIFNDIPASTNSGNYRMRFHMDAIKSTSHHAYDFVTTWDNAIDATNQIAPSPLTQPVPLYPPELKTQTDAANLLACANAPNSGNGTTLYDVCLALRAAGNTNVSFADLDPTQVAGFDPFPSGSGDSVSAKVTAYQNLYGTANYPTPASAKNHAIKFYSNAAIDSATLNLLGYDPQGNSNWELRWHSNGTPTQLLIEFGAHIAVGVDTLGIGVGYGATKGASFINGGPYHVSVDLFDFGVDGKADDTSLGSQDNQLQGADILVPPSNPSIVTHVHNTSHVDITNTTVAPGTSVHDSATVDSGNVNNPIPAGSTFTFKLFDNASCSGSPVSTESVAVPSGAETGTAESTPFTPAGGGHGYLVDFTSGNTAIVRSKTAVAPTDCEPFTVQGTSTLATTIHRGTSVGEGTAVVVVEGGSVPLATIMHDLATVTVSGSTAPTGTVNFRFYTSAAACTGDTTFTGGSTLGSASIANVSGTYIAHPSSDTSALTVGSYAFKAQWAGDTNYTGSTSACENFSVSPATPTLATTMHSGTSVGEVSPVVVSEGGSVALGAIMHDLATLGSVISGQAPTGTVSFRFYSTQAACTADTAFTGGATAGSASVALVSGAYVAHPSDNTTALTAGSYAFKARYGGDTNYNAATSPCENFTVGQATLSLATVLHQGTSASEGTPTVVAVNGTVPLGTIMHDLANVTGLVSGIAPTNPVTFQFYSNASCTSGSAAGSAAIVNGVAHPSSDTAALSAGAKAFRAFYDGSTDPNYGPDSISSDCEPFTVGQAALSLATVLHQGTSAGEGTPAIVAVNGTVPLGTIMHDLANVSGIVGGFAPSNPVTFQFYTNNACTAGSAAGSATIVNGVAHPSSDTAALSAGAKAFRAFYDGSTDPNYGPDSISSDCEPFTVNKGNLTLTTTVHTDSPDAALVGNAALGASLHDRADVTGFVTGIPFSNQVSFVFFSDPAAGACSGTSVSKGSVAIASGVAHPSQSSGALGAGDYAFQASLASDANYNVNNQTGTVAGDCEPFSVNKAPSSTVTELHNASTEGVIALNSSVPLGTSVHDKATVSDLVAGFDPTGDVTFTFFGNNSCTPTGSGAGTITLVSGVAHPSSATGALGAGSYSFRATYNGDANFASSTSDCEPFNVSKAPTNTVTTLHNGPVNDTANPLVLAVNGNATSDTVHDSSQTTGQVGTITLTGSVTFRFYGTAAACTADTTFTGGALKGTVTIASGAAHPSDAATALGAGYYAFRAAYSGDANYNASLSACEPFYVTTLQITKYIHGLSTTFSYDVTGANTLNAGTTPSTNITPPDNGNASFGPVVIVPGNDTIAEHTPLPAGYVLTDVSCTGYTGGGTGAGAPDGNGVPVNWNWTAAPGNAVLCTYVNSAVQTTRTQGFWATHTVLANSVWNGTSGLPAASTLGVDATLCAGPLNSGNTGGQALLATTAAGTNEVLGGFWASISKLSDPTLKNKQAQRSDLDQARMQMLQQYLAAVLNVHAFGAGSSQMLADARAAYCGTDIGAIKNQIGILGTFNQSGDSLPFTPGASATPDESKKEANIPFWDVTYRKP